MKTTFKKSISVVLAIVMVLMSVCVFSTSVSAAEDNTFSVTAASNIPKLFPEATSTFDASTKQITITYWFNLPNHEMVNSQWVLNYDKDALQYDDTDDVNQVNERGKFRNSLVLRAAGETASGTFVNVKADEGRIVGNCSKPSGYKVEEGRRAFISVTFNVLDTTKDNINVMLNFSVMQVREPDSDPKESPITFVKGGKIINDEVEYVSNPAYSAVYGGTFDEEYVPVIKTDDVSVYGSSVSITESFSISFFVNPSLLKGYSDFYMEMTRNGKTIEVHDYTVYSGLYRFQYKNIYPQLLADEVTAVLYMEKDGVLYRSESYTRSVKSYAESQLSKTTSPALRTLLVDMLNYGAQAQIYAKENTKNLANSGLTEEQKSWASEEPVISDISDSKYKLVEGEEKATWYSAQVVLSQTVQVNPIFAMDDPKNKTIEIKAENRTFRYTEDDFKLYSDGLYQVVCDQLYAGQMSTPLYITVYENGVPCSNTCRYSIESYICRMHNRDYTGKETLDPLLMSIIKYGKSAEAYATTG